MYSISDDLAWNDPFVIVKLKFSHLTKTISQNSEIFTTAVSEKEIIAKFKSCISKIDHVRSNFVDGGVDICD